MTLPLSGIRVLDLTHFEQGPLASALLAEWGADVIKIEGPDRPDPGRRTESNGTGAGFYFETNNHSKRSLCIDLQTAAGREVFYRMAKQADVFVQNMSPRTAAKLGVDYATLSKLNPRIICATASAFGKQGPHSDRRGMAMHAYARGGVMSVTGEPDGPPHQPGSPYADRMGSLLLAYGVLLALLQRERDGMGQEVDGSLLQAQVFFNGWRFTDYLFNGVVAKRLSRFSQRALWNVYQGSDKEWFVIGEPRQGEVWQTICVSIGRADLEDHPGIQATGGNAEQLRELITVLDGVFAQRTAAEWVEHFRGIGIMSELVQDYAQLAADPQVVANDMIKSYEHPKYGVLRLPAGGVELGRARPVVEAAPEFGQHTEEVLLEFAFSTAEIEALAQQGVIGPRPAAVIG
jgi:crotonobetainyl-CoA:carnitine CoA-transferase CaiB-like acyl-CoA transferase